MNRITFLLVTIILESILQISLSTTPSLSQARSSLVGITVCDIVLFAGGINSPYANSYSDRVDIYNYTSNTWTTATLSQPRTDLAATSVGSLAFFAGGLSVNYSTFVYHNTVDIYNCTSNTWNTSSLSQGRYDLAATSIGNFAIFAGGTTNDVFSNVVDIYDAVSKTWMTVTLPQPRSKMVGTSIGNIALFGGGLNLTFTGGYSDRVDIFNATSFTWNTTKLSRARAYLATTSIGDLAIFAGGQNSSSQITDAVDIYNHTSNTWNTTTLSQPRGALIGTRIGNLAIFAGGGSGGFSDQVDIYNYSSNTWSTAILSQPRAYLAATTVSDLALFAGGSNYGYSAQVDIYNITSNEWSPSITCQPGTLRAYYLPTVECLICTEGTYSNTTNSLYCYDCPPGTYSNMNGTTQCPNCSGGTYCAYGRCTNCDPCQAGSSSNSGSSNCTLCPPGTYSLEGSPCVSCLEGTASGATGATSVDTCQTCGTGQYSLEGASQCLTCPNGTTSKPGSSSCSEPEDTKGQTGISSSAKIAIATVAAVFGLTLIGIILALIRFSKKQLDIKLELVDVGHWTVVDNIEIGERLGGGNFGDVFKGTWNGTTTVALKKLKSSEHLEEFAKEADVLQSLNHPNIVRFLGIHTNSAGEQFIVMEYLSKGSVDALIALEKRSIQLVDLLAMAKDAAAGMLYLEQQQIVHRDLALRNLLVAPDQKDKYTVKVSDFGLSRQIKEEGFYMKPESTGIPIRWSAPEVLEKGVYTSKSDVWSFGIMLWELFTYGKIPYTGMTNAEVMQRVVSGHRLSCPEGCPQELYELMGRCWHHRPEARPGFKEIYDKIASVWEEYRQGNVDIRVENSQQVNANFRSNANYGNRDVQQPSNANYNNESVNIQQSSNTNNSNYNNQSRNMQYSSHDNYN